MPRGARLHQLPLLTPCRHRLWEKDDTSTKVNACLVCGEIKVRDCSIEVTVDMTLRLPALQSVTAGKCGPPGRVIHIPALPLDEVLDLLAGGQLSGDFPLPIAHFVSDISTGRDNVVPDDALHRVQCLITILPDDLLLGSEARETLCLTLMTPAICHSPKYAVRPDTRWYRCLVMIDLGRTWS